MNREELITICERMDACDESTAWLDSLTCDTAAECWHACERGDWMIWLLAACDCIVPNRTLRLIAVDCARAVHHIADAWFAQHAPQHVGAGVRLLDLIESDPDADPHTWATAYDAASDAARCAWSARAMMAARAAMDAAMYAAWSATRGAAWSATRGAARAARDAAWDAEWAARDAARDAACDAWDAACDAARADQARIIRSRVTWAEVERGLRGVA